MGSRKEVCRDERGRAGLIARALIAVAIQLAVARTAFAETQALDQKSEPTAEEKAEIERLRKEASETLLKGEFDRARKEFEAVLKLAPQDEQAERDAARAAAAAGQFEYAVEALEKAHHFEHHTADPELHYLRGEALYTLGRDEEAAREHHIAELEIGPEPKDRMRKLWLARIYGRRGYVVLADRLYDSMLPPPPAKDTEVALNQADAHLINKDWTGGAKVLRRYLAVDPSSVRGREMLAWALEAGGDLEGEIAVRRSLVMDQPTPANKRDYGRALERASDFRGARDAYGGAVAAGPSPENTLVISYDRMRYRTTPELAGGGQFRSDPQAWAWHVQTGGALPFGSRHQLSLLAWHDSSTDWQPNQVVGSNVVAESGTVTGLGASALFANRRGGWFLAGVDARVSSSEGIDSAGVEQFGPIWKLRFGGQLELDTPIFSFMQISARADVNEQWNEAPVTVEKAGAQTGAIAHLFLFPESRVVLFDTGAAVRRLSVLAPLGGPSPTADQLLAWGGIDFNLWASPTRILRGEALDDRMVRRTYLNDAGVLAFRHYELVTHAEPTFSIALAPRSSINNGSLIIRKVLPGGWSGFDLHGGAGYDNARDHFLAQAGASVLLATSWSTRLSASYDISRDTATGLTGTLQIAWLTFHADL